jgi:hypothetical protein
MKGKNPRRRAQLIALALSSVLAGGLLVQPSARAFTFDISNILKYLEKLYAAYGSISTGNWEDLIGVIKEAMGDLGIIDPQAASHEVSSSTYDPDAQSDGFIKDPDFPEAIFDAQRSTDAVSPTIAQKLSGIVLGTQGQTILKDQSQLGADALTVSNSGLEGTVVSAKKSQESAEKSLEASKVVSDLAKESQSRQASQDILKDIAAQNGSIGQILFEKSSQNSALSASLSNQSAQLLSLQAQNRIVSDQLQVLEILSASQNQMMTEVDSTIDQQLQHNLEAERRSMMGAYESSSIVYLPGLMKQ